MDYSQESGHFFDYSPIGTTQAGYSSIEYLHQRNLKSQTKGHYSEKIHIFDTQTNKKFNLISKSRETTIRHKDNSFEEYPEKSRFYSSYIGNVKTLTDNNKIAKEKKEQLEEIIAEKDSNVLVSEFITYTCSSKNPNDKNTLYIT